MFIFGVKLSIFTDIWALLQFLILSTLHFLCPFSPLGYWFFSFLSLLFLKNILFIWLDQVLVEGREVFDLYYSMWTLSCGMWDLIDNQGSNPGPLHWELGVLATGPPGKSSVIFFLGNILGTLYILGILVLCDMLQTFFQCIIFLLTFLCGIFW